MWVLSDDPVSRNWYNTEPTLYQILFISDVVYKSKFLNRSHSANAKYATNLKITITQLRLYYNFNLIIFHFS